MSASAEAAGAVPEIPLSVQFRRESGRFLAIGYEHTIELSETAAFICRQVDGRLSIAAIAAIVAAEYAIEESTALEDVGSLLADLSDYGLVSWVG